jgi:uncharacterized paraquat-inducible protein A
MIHGKSNEVKWRDKGCDHCDCAIERPTVSDEESNKCTQNELIGRVETTKEKGRDNEYK